MKGLIVKGAPYEFEDLIAPVADLLSEYYWLIEAVYFRRTAPDGTTFDDYENRYEELILQTGSRYDLSLTKRGFIVEYAKLIQGDWDHICGLNEPMDISGLSIDLGYDKDFIERHAEVYFRCIDAAFWIAYAKDARLLQRIKERFPLSEDCSLADEHY